jgi:aldehyde dehydrogenase (NAD+)/betaine-aldehyde dehydrogenase
VDGRWVGGESTYFTRNPATGEVIAEIPVAGEKDVDAAVEAAASAFVSPEWAGLLPAQRAWLLLRVADLLEERADEFARLETLDPGQPLAVSAGFSVPNAIEHFRYFAGRVTKITGITAPLSIPGVDYRTRREPLGVCALIAPWNFPLTIMVWKLAPALSTGITVVIKPAEQTPLTTMLLAEVLEDRPEFWRAWSTSSPADPRPVGRSYGTRRSRRSRSPVRLPWDGRSRPKPVER